MATQMFGTSPPVLDKFSIARKHRGRRALALGLVATAAIAAFIGGIGATASAAPGSTSGDTTDGHVGVNSGITLSGLTQQFTLNGAPGAVVSEIGAVTMNVLTNNIAGYVVTVKSQSATMVAATGGNGDSIPIANLRVRQTNDPTYIPISSTSAVGVHSQSARSAPAGDAITNDYEVLIPFVASDTYSATLDYIATTL